MLAALAYAMVPVVFTQYTRLHPAAVSGLVVFANCLVTMVVFFDHDTGSPASFFYLWVTPYAMVFFSTRHALAHVAFVAVSYAVVLLILADRGEGGSEAAHWVHTMGALVVTVLLVRALEPRCAPTSRRSTRSGAGARSRSTTTSSSAWCSPARATRTATAPSATRRSRSRWTARARSWPT